MTRFLLLLVCLCSLGQTLAETRYITDIAQILLRKGEGIRYKIIRTLTSGEPVEELGVNRASGYSRVRTKDGTIGYVLTRQLQDEPGVREQLAAMEARLAEFQQAPDQLVMKLAELQETYNRLKIEKESLEQQKDELEEELAAIKYASNNLVQITQERSDLNKRVGALILQVAELEQKNRDKKNETNQRWFLIGAGVVIVSLLLGLILPHLSFRRRKDSWGGGAETMGGKRHIGTVPGELRSNERHGQDTRDQNQRSMDCRAQGSFVFTARQQAM